MVSSAREGNLNRVTARTAMNDASSRSHCIFSVAVRTTEERDADDGGSDDGSDGGGDAAAAAADDPARPLRRQRTKVVVRHGKLNIVDLAGSEVHRGGGAARKINHGLRNLASSQPIAHRLSTTE